MLTLARTITNSVKQVLHALGVDVDAQTKAGMTATMDAGYEGHVESVKLLHAMKADFNVRDERGRTVMHHSARYDHTEMLKVVSRQSNLEHWSTVEMRMLLLVVGNRTDGMCARE